MKFLTDFFPLIIFFGAYQYTKDLITATIGLIIATIIQVLYTWLRFHRVEKMHLITLAAVVVLGSATVILDNDAFIMWKPTVVNWILAIVFFGSQFIGKRNLLRRMLESNVELPEHVWRNLNIAWVLFFIISGLLNIYVAFNFDQETWVNFKVFGLLALTIVFVILQTFYMTRHIDEDSDSASSAESRD